MTLDFFQIYYDDNQKPSLYDFSIPYKNTTFSPYFENSVIANLVPKSKADLIGVCSWRLREKRQQGWTPVILGDTGLTKEKILSHEFDVAVLCPFDQKHETMEKAHHWHGQAWDDAINELRSIITIPDKLEGNAIYQNHFIARKEIYQEYVNTCLAPVISFMEDKEVFKRPSGYIYKKKDPKEVNRTLRLLSEYYGHMMADYPIAPFILERLFRIWIEGKGFKLVNL